MTLGTAAAGSVKAGGGTYNIGFNDGDETKFDAYDLAELLDCWVEFCAENGFQTNSVDYLEEQWAEELAECPACGKWFWCYGEHYCPHCGAKHDEEPDDNAWYVEKWYDEDLINALKEIGVTASEKNLERLKSECLHIFDDKSTRNEMLADKAREIFEEE